MKRSRSRVHQIIDFPRFQQAVASNCSRDPFNPPYVTYIASLRRFRSVIPGVYSSSKRVNFCDKSPIEQHSLTQWNPQ